jgi:hypothetical protein
MTALQNTLVDGFKTLFIDYCLEPKFVLGAKQNLPQNFKIFRLLLDELIYDLVARANVSAGYDLDAKVKGQQLEDLMTAPGTAVEIVQSIGRVMMMKGEDAVDSCKRKTVGITYTVLATYLNRFKATASGSHWTRFASIICMRKGNKCYVQT